MVWFPYLQIIRGRDLFKLNVKEEAFALIVTLSKMHNLELPALRGRTFNIFVYFSIICFEKAIITSKAKILCDF
jgi:hypothetical protein